jgi:excisionase family DNA binding protein
MSTGLTFEQAAAILGCHFSNVAKLIRRGHLTSTGKRGASLNREQVEAQAKRRAAERAARAARSPRKFQRVDHCPDHDHEWLSPRQVAGLLGVTRPAVQGRIHRGTLPATENGGRFWVRRDHLEQVEAPGWCGRRDVTKARPGSARWSTSCA